MEFTVQPAITKEYLLEQNTQETYLQYYLGIPVRKGLFKSPLRQDKKPTCSFYISKRNGDIIFKDFSGAFSGNFIQIVQHLNSCSYGEALNIIANDFGYIQSNISRKPNIIPIADAFIKEDFTNIRVQIKDFSEQELEWWNKHGITIEILNKYNVFSCQTIFLNNEIFTFSNKNKYIFGYYYGKLDDKEYWRIYMPLQKEYRFISNWKKEMIQ